jgi:hypothetical protein
MRRLSKIKRVKLRYLTFFSVADEWFWVSASDIGRTYGHFHWADGSPVDNIAWQSGQPIDARQGQETCIFLHPDQNWTTGDVQTLFTYCAKHQLRSMPVCENADTLRPQKKS